MANNFVEYLAQLKAKDPKRANWLLDCPDVGTNDFGFFKVRFCRPVIAGTNVRYDFKSAYSTNATIAPVLSRAKATIVAIWAPIRLYVPALRDGVQVKAGKADYSFPTINFDYPQIRSTYDASLDIRTGYSGHGLPYIPANSIFSELKMWAPYFQPIGFAHSLGQDASPYPEAKNVIPLLAYYDFYRNYVINSQSDQRIPLRVKGFSRQFISGAAASDDGYVTQVPRDNYIRREDFDNLFQQVRSIGSSYPMGDGNYDVTSALTRFMGTGNGTFAPSKSVEMIGDAAGSDTVFAAYNDNHFGELRDTYFSDYFTAFLSNENVEYERSIARVQVDDEGFITMEQIYSAEKIQNFVRRTVFKNSDYAEFIDAQYGVKPSTDLTKPMFLGSVSTWLTFNDVISQAQTSEGNSELSTNTDLGSRASLGFGRMVTGKLRSKDDRHFVNFTAREPGYFMVLESIVPEVCYWQGFDPMYDKRSLDSIYYPSFDKDGYQDKQMKYLVEQPMATFNKLPRSTYFNLWNVAYAQEPAWWEYMSTHGRLSGQMVENGVYRHWVFRRESVHSDNNHPVSDSSAPPGYTTSIPVDFAKNVYVDPEPFNEIFANINGLDNIQTYYKHEFKVYQPLSHRFLSF